MTPAEAVPYVFLAMMALQVADAWTTIVILERGGRELNPLVRWVIDRVGPRPAMVVKLLAILGVAFWIRHWPGLSDRQYLFILGCVIVVSAWPVVNNVQVLLKRRT